MRLVIARLAADADVQNGRMSSAPSRFQRSRFWFRLASASYPRSIEKCFAVGAVGAARNHQGPALDGPVIVVDRCRLAKTAAKVMGREPVCRTGQGEVA